MSLESVANSVLSKLRAANPALQAVESVAEEVAGVASAAGFPIAQTAVASLAAVANEGVSLAESAAATVASTVETVAHPNPAAEVPVRVATPVSAPVAPVLTTSEPPKPVVGAASPAPAQPVSPISDPASMAASHVADTATDEVMQRVENLEMLFHEFLTGALPTLSTIGRQLGI